MFRISIFLVLLAGFVEQAFANPIDEVRIGVLAQSCCGFARDEEQGVALNIDAAFSAPRVLRVIGAPRPVVGATIATDSDATSQIYAGLEWRLEHRRFFVSGLAGGAIHNGETDRFDPVEDADRSLNTLFFGCRALFRLSADLGYRVTDRLRASVHWSHISNANLCSDNEGLDHLGARIGVGF